MNPKRAGNSLPTALPTEPTNRFGGVTVRSVLLGFCCVIFIAAYAPYNDLGLNNTMFIGNHFPIGITFLMCIFILGLNPLLRWIDPKRALQSSELMIIWAMCLVGAAFPTAGLLRQLIPWLISPTYLLPHHPEWQVVLDFLPDWLFPTRDPKQDAIVTNFFLGTDPGEPRAVPWGAWAGPLAMWALYFVPFFIGVLLLSVLLSQQWIVREKLQYPIATVMLEMVRDAPPGSRWNAIFRDRRMWVGAGMVMTVHLINGLHFYFPKVPSIPIGFDMTNLFTEGVWAHNMWYMTSCTVYFSMLGIAFLMASEVSLSLWFFVVLYGGIIAVLRYQGFDPWEAMRTQSYGAILAMGGYLLFLARSHLWRAFRMAFGSARDPLDQRYIAYRWVVWGLIFCIAACLAWLWASGMPLIVAAAQIILLYLIYLVMARLVAETGMFFVLPRMWTEHLFQLLVPYTLSAKTYALVTSSVFPSFYPRETLMPFAFNALRLGHEAGKQEPHHRDRTAVAVPEASGAFVSTLISCIILSLVVAGAVSILLYYSRGAIRTNSWFAITWCSNQCDYMVNYLNGIPSMPGHGPAYMAIGAGLIVMLGFFRLRFARWPLVPIALCVATSDALGYMWFSILIGWICKTCVMRVGGISVYNRVRPAFLGMVIGEILIAGAWMVVGAVIRMNGYELDSVRILPS